MTSVLGFDGSQVATLPLQENALLAGGIGGGTALGQVSYPKWNEAQIKPGITMTENFNSINAGLYTLGTDGSPSATPPILPTPFWAVKQPGEYTEALVNTSDRTVGMVASNTQDFSELNFGYYLLEIQSVFMNNFISKISNDGDVLDDANMRSINSVIGRFYSKNAYTQSQSSGLLYQHRGEPIVLNNFKVRILDSSKNIPRLGNDNSVILQVNRGVPQLPPPSPEPSGKKK